jgi:PAS domain S-box-containing protein
MKDLTNASKDSSGLVDLDSPEQTIWRSALDALPNGCALLDPEDGKTLWANSALLALLRDGTGTTHIAGRAPNEYPPGLEACDWDEALEIARASTGSASPILPRRLQFVHYATRNIAYWEWTVRLVSAGAQGQAIVLNVQAVSDRVLNERVLASAGRAAERARRRAEALMRLAQVVNASITTSDVIKAITHQAAAYFDSRHAAVLLLDPDKNTLTVGYAIGLEDEPSRDRSAMDLYNTVAGRAISQRKTHQVNNLYDSNVHVPTLDNGQAPYGLISSPIWQGGRDYGVVEVYFAEPRDVPDNAMAMLAAFADQTAVALHKSDLYDELAGQQRQLQSIVENAPVGIIYFDIDGTAVTANEAAASRYGVAVSDIVGQSFEQYLTDLPSGLLDQVRGGTPFHASHHVHTSPNNEQIVCDLSLRPIRDKSGTVVGLLLLSFEVTELVTARQEADQARRSAEHLLAQVQATQLQMVQVEKMRAIGELASGVAHDFNNALMAILGYTELAEESLDDPEELAKQLAIIRKAAEDASTTVERLQRFAKQRVKAHGELTDVNAIVQDVIDMTRPRWKDSAQREGRIYEVSANLHPVPPIIAEPSGLREVMVNLIHNALNAMPNGGKLMLSTQAAGTDQVEISIEDNGIGMSPEVAARVFDPFFTTRGVEGTGLGLAVSWTIVQRYGGFIELDTSPGQGARFMLRFPVATESNVELRQTTKRAPSPRVTGGRALVVDDEPFVASVLMTILTRHGYEVVAVHSGKAALECLAEKTDTPFDIVLTDHGMPDLTGLQLVAEVKRLYPDLPVLLLTGWGESVLDTHITDVFPDAVLGKPINQLDLVDAIARVLKSSSKAVSS